MKQIVIELSDELYKEIASEDAVYYPDDGGVVWQAVEIIAYKMYRFLT